MALEVTICLNVVRFPWSWIGSTGVVYPAGSPVPLEETGLPSNWCQRLADGASPLDRLIAETELDRGLDAEAAERKSRLLGSEWLSLLSGTGSIDWFFCNAIETKTGLRCRTALLLAGGTLLLLLMLRRE